VAQSFSTLMANMPLYLCTTGSLYRQGQYLYNKLTFRFMQATAKTATRRVLGIRGGQGETLVPPTAVAGGDEGFVFEFEASDNNNSG
jgi:hypothetical protein